MKRDGFTLIELIVTLAVLGIATAIAVPNYLGVQGASHESSCTQQRALIDKVLNEQMAQQPGADPETLLQAILDDTEGLYFSDQPHCPGDGDYTVYELEDGTYGVSCSLHGAPEGVAAFSGYTYDFSDGNVTDWEDIGIIGYGDFTYNEETGKFVSRSGSAFIQYEQSDHYKLSTTADLTANSNGYGFFLETSLNEDNKDTGTIIQFDPGLGTMIAMREREDGKEFSPERIDVGDFIDEAQVKENDESNWWKSEHTMSLEVETIDDNTKGVRVYIDDVAIFNEGEYSYEIQANQEEETYTGFRTWSGDVEFSTLAYENLE